MIQKVWNESKIEDRLQLKAIQLRRPLSCTLELTYRCNFSCRMCYVRMSDAIAVGYGRMRTVEEWLDMAKQLRDAGVLYLTLTGGECTLYPGFEELYAQIAQMGFRLSVMSNAGAYTDAIRTLFSKYPPHSLCVTLYGGSNETYRAVTGDPKGFEKAVENIRFLQSIGVRVALNYTMVRSNACDYPNVAALCAELGAPCTLITDITGHRHGAGLSEAYECRLSPAQRACIACHPPGEVQLALENAKELEKDLADFRMPEANADGGAAEPDACIGAYTSCAIFWNGEMNTCISMNGNSNVKPFETGFETAWGQLKARQDETFLRPAACRACGMKAECMHNCAGRRFEGTGSEREPDPYTCQYTWLLRRYRARRKGADIPPAPACS